MPDIADIIKNKKLNNIVKKNVNDYGNMKNDHLFILARLDYGKYYVSCIQRESLKGLRYRFRNDPNYKMLCVWSSEHKMNPLFIPFRYFVKDKMIGYYENNNIFITIPEIDFILIIDQFINDYLLTFLNNKIIIPQSMKEWKDEIINTNNSLNLWLSENIIPTENNENILQIKDIKERFKNTESLHSIKTNMTYFNLNVKTYFTQKGFRYYDQYQYYEGERKKENRKNVRNVLTNLKLREL